MLLETEKERVCINKKVGQSINEIKVEGDVIVNDIKPDVLNIISADGIPCVYKKEVMEGKIRIDGSINTYIIYLADDENASVRSLNTVLDFTQVIDMEGCMPDMSLKESVNIKRIDTRILNGRKINLKIDLNICSEVCSDEEMDIVSNINSLEDVQILNKEKVINSLIGKGNTKMYAKDTISVDSADEIAEIMKTNVNIINKDIKLSYNKVLVKADAEILILYLTEDNRIKSTSTKIPVMGFVDIENINDNAICDVDYEIKNVIIKPNSGDMNSIYVEIEVESLCCAYETKSVNLIEDLYSIDSNLNFTQKEINAISKKKNIIESFNIAEEINIPEINGNILYNVKSTPNILNTTIKNGKIIYEGEILVELLFEINNGIDAKNIKLPFNFEVINNEINENCKINTNIEIKNDNFVLNNNYINCNIELAFNISLTENETVKIIDEIMIEENRENNIYSMVIYFVKSGDTLWQIAKKFRTTVDDIAKVNAIENENKIYIGQQLYIPKYAKKEIKV